LSDKAELTHFGIVNSVLFSTNVSVYYWPIY